MMKMIDEARMAIHERVHDIRIDLGHGSLSFDYSDSARRSKSIRLSQQPRFSERPNDVSIITYDVNSGDGKFLLRSAARSSQCAINARCADRRRHRMLALGHLPWHRWLRTTRGRNSRPHWN